jgi:hypothetical protein
MQALRKQMALSHYYCDSSDHFATQEPLIETDLGYSITLLLPDAVYHMLE